MPKKKTPKNAFYFFMKDVKEEQEQLGHVFPRGMKDVAEMAGPLWEELSPDARIHYEERATQEKLKDKANMENKFTTTGLSYAQLERDEVERRSTILRMKMEIEGTIQGLDRDSTLKTHAFYFIHFNYYCRVEDGSYLICEVAVARFNLKEGVKDVYHTLIRHDKIPTGYSFEAKQTSEETHQIPMPQDLQEGEKYRGGLFCYIKSFLEQNKMSKGGLPPLYSIDSHVDIAQSALNCMAEYHYPQNPDLFRVYPLSRLFYHLRNAAALPGCTAFPAETLAERELDKDQYNFAPGIACSMHENNDTCVYCSKSIVQRWAFLICDHCCRDLGILMLRGRHVPINAAIHVDILQDEAAAAMLPMGGGFQQVNRKGARGSRPARGHSFPQAPSSPKEAYPAPISVVDYSKVSPPEDKAHHFTLNAAAADFSPSGRTLISGRGGNAWGGRGRGDLLSGCASPTRGPGDSHSVGTSPVGGAVGQRRQGSDTDAVTGGSVWGKATAAATAAPAASMDEAGNGTSVNNNDAIPKSMSGGCWGAISSGDAVPTPTLRHPTTLPPSIANALKFTEADFPDLGGGRNSSRIPAAVAGRGRGRAKLLLDDSGPVPGGLNVTDDDSDIDPVAMGRGRGRPASSKKRGKGQKDHVLPLTFKG